MELNYKKSDTIVISDIHIGSKNSKTDKLYDFLDLLLENPPKRLIVAGDLFELWSTSYKKIGKYDHKVIRKILELSQNKIEIIYIPGNHDRAFRAFRKFTLGNIDIKREYLIRHNGKKYIVMHGDEFDAFTRNHVILSLIIDQLYIVIIKWSAFVKRFFGLRMSLSSRKKSKRYLKIVKKIKKAALTYARSVKVDGIIIGHTHYPEIFKNIDGIVYANSGDWIDSLSYIVISDDIKLQYFK
ncbi:UDP-2,3-diacylglucosamine hydrolase [bacterium BMS3Abin15]|nr:UDP-2,3-diacylglucosamine hydrolase [bacterium BMS3Abin15]HDH07719.1 UDP-2,3-diacylglucosamine diphosphatase [Candidatus Moranbacteria bacterium]